MNQKSSEPRISRNARQISGAGEVADDHQPPAVEPVGQDAADRRQHEQRQLLRDDHDRHRDALPRSRSARSNSATVRNQSPPSEISPPT